MARDIGQRKGRELGQRGWGNSEQKKEPNMEIKNKVIFLKENSMTICQGELEDEDWGMRTTRGRC